ncbi:MAG: ChaB family protein [Thiohalophilus sp.]|jgi:cation transport regulator
MPYDRIDQLPDSVRNNLPKEAQQIYKEAFNNAWEEYSDRSDREATAHKVAWAAVKKKYEKSSGKWVKK